MAVSSTSASKDELIYEEALINTYLSAIRNATEGYYADYYTVTPTVSYYSVELKEIRSSGQMNPSVYMTFLSMPYVGPHDTVGEDELIFLASYTGEVTLIDFQHIKSYELPDNLKDLIK